MSGVTCIFYFFLQSYWAGRWRVCYQQGLPSLVTLITGSFLNESYMPSTVLEVFVVWVSGAKCAALVMDNV